MKLTTTLAGISALVATLISTGVYAQNSATPRFDQRQANQGQRIDRGEASGQITQKEAARLEKGQDHLQTLEDKAKADGSVTRKERAHLQHAENNQSRKIARQAHDGQRDKNHDGVNDRRERRAAKAAGN